MTITGNPMGWSSVIDNHTYGIEEDGCPTDLDGDGGTATADLLILLAAWGPCPGCLADINFDGIVSTEDLLILLSSWGPCPQTMPVDKARRQCP